MRNQGAFCLYAETVDAPAGASHDAELPNMLHNRELIGGPLLEMGCTSHFDFESTTGTGGNKAYFSRALIDSTSLLSNTSNVKHHRLKHHPCSTGALSSVVAGQFWPNGPLYQGPWHEDGMATGGYFQISGGDDGIFSDPDAQQPYPFGSVQNNGTYPVTVNAWIKGDDLSSLAGGESGVHPVVTLAKEVPYIKQGNLVDLSTWKAVGIGFQTGKNTVPCIFEMSVAAASGNLPGDLTFTASKILGADPFRMGSLNTSTAPTTDHTRWHMLTAVFLSQTNVRMYWNGIRVADYESGEGKNAAGTNESFSFQQTLPTELASTVASGPWSTVFIGGLPPKSVTQDCLANRTVPLPAPCFPGKIGNVSLFPSSLSSIQVAELYSTTTQAMTIELDLTTAGTAGFLGRQVNKFDDSLPQILVEAHSSNTGSTGTKRSWSTGMWHAHMDLDTQTGRLTVENGDQSNSSTTTGFGFAAMVGESPATVFDSLKTMNFGSGNKNVGFGLDVVNSGPRIRLRSADGAGAGVIRTLRPTPVDRIIPRADAMGKKDIITGFFTMSGVGIGTDGVNEATANAPAGQFTHHLKDNFPITFFKHTAEQKTFLPIVFFNEHKSASEQLTIVKALKGNNPMRTRVPLTASPRPFRLNGTQTGRKIP